MFESNYSYYSRNYSSIQSVPLSVSPLSKTGVRGAGAFLNPKTSVDSGISTQLLLCSLRLRKNGLNSGEIANNENILEDFENASPYFCIFLAKCIWD